MIKIVIVDDHAVVRRGIINIISAENDITVTGEASSYEELVEKIDYIDCDIIILDITMPGKNGLDALIELKQLNPGLKIIILSMHSDEEIIRRAFKTGCSAYLNKDSVPEELVKALRFVNDGGRYIGTSLAVKIELYTSPDLNKQPHEKLSTREYQILCLIASGYSLTEISNKLSINVKTVGTYRTRILQKMDLKSNVELTHYAIKNKLVLNVFQKASNILLDK
jgi:DNA-binding NarL/FixJ family response regulator